MDSSRNSSAATIGDFNGDGRIALAIASFSVGLVYLYQGGGTFNPATKLDFDIVITDPHSLGGVVYAL